MRDFTENDLLDLEIRYKNDQTVLDLITLVKEQEQEIYGLHDELQFCSEPGE